MNVLPEKDLFRVDEVAVYFNISRATLYRWISDGMPGGGQFDAVRIGKKLRIRRSTIIEIQKSINGEADKRV